jgi:hypothetical protein
MQDPVWHIIKAQKGWNCGSSGREPAYKHKTLSQNPVLSSQKKKPSKTTITSKPTVEKRGWLTEKDKTIKSNKRPDDQIRKAL